MSDIVERLRAQADADFNTRLWRASMREAAAEIERLRAGGCARNQGTTQYCAEAAAMADEIERLRAVLIRIADLCDEHSQGGAIRGRQWAAEVAAAALKGKSHE